MNIRSYWILFLSMVSWHSASAAISTDSIDAQLEIAIDLIYKNPADAEKIANEALTISEELNYKTGMGDAFRVIGLSYFIRGDYDLSVENLLQSYALFESLQDSLMLGQVLGNLGVVYKNLKNYDKSLEYYERALDVTDTGDTLVRSKIYNNIGVVQQRMEKFDQALDNFERSLELKQYLGNQKGISNTLTNLGNVSIRLGRLREAMKYFKSSMAIEEELDHEEGLAKSYNNIAGLYLKMYEHDSALFYARRALEIGEALGTKFQIKESSAVLSACYEHFQNYKSAYKYKVLQYAMNDSISNEEVARKLGQLESKLELIKQQKAIESLTLNNTISKIELENKNLHIQWLTISLLITLVAATVVIRLIYSRFQLKRQLHLAEISELRAQIKTLFEGDTTELGLDSSLLNDKLEEPLTEREFEILEYAIGDLNNTEIAEKIFVSVNTVKYHLKNIYQKLGVSNRKQALEYVIKTK